MWRRRPAGRRPPNGPLRHVAVGCQSQQGTRRGLIHCVCEEHSPKGQDGEVVTGVRVRGWHREEGRGMAPGGSRAGQGVLWRMVVGGGGRDVRQCLWLCSAFIFQPWSGQVVEAGAFIFSQWGITSNSLCSLPTICPWGGRHLNQRRCLPCLPIPCPCSPNRGAVLARPRW